VDLNAYRIIQESLTNALKHGGPKATADVTVAYHDADVAITVLDDGRGSAAPSNGGHGLVGMHERIALLNGELEAGPRPGGGFQVRATIPVAP
jgi:signal transduction histidine kinase